MLPTMHTTRSILAILTWAVLACGEDGGSPIPDARPSDAAALTDSVSAADAPPPPFLLTSTAYAEAATIPAAHTCDGANTSPALGWTGAPAGTHSFAIVFTDSTNGLIHSVIYDIPSTTLALPADVDKAYAPADVPGAHQTIAYNMSTRGYLGPCPPAADGAHTYVLKLYALSVPTLPTATMTTTRTEARTLIEANDISQTTLTGTYDR